MFHPFIFSILLVLFQLYFSQRNNCELQIHEICLLITVKHEHCITDDSGFISNSLSVLLQTVMCNYVTDR